MARPKADRPAPGAVRALIDHEGRLFLKVTPGARTESLEIVEGRLLVKVRAKPDDGKANLALQALLAAALDVPRSRVALLRGATSREKVFRIER